VSPEDQEALRDDLLVLGLPDAEVPKSEDVAFDVHEDNWAIVMAFLSVQTQWTVVAGMGGAVRTGLDYSGVWAVLNGMCTRKQRAELFAGIQVMEVSALPLMNKR
jgi:hypothetical protein